ncbi:hypothetical protein C7N43_37380 [Sphingobacteriales bacterium UPWRP_1]|nr:hypothetical protein C7N43_37380 [Sphingobacteriales bacterium UPWRP_1]
MSNTTVQIGTVNFLAQKRAGITVLAALLADLIFQLQQNPDAETHGWCCTKDQYFAEALGIAKNTARGLISELIDAGLLQTNGLKNQKRLLRTTSLYFSQFICLSPAHQNLVSVTEETASAHQNLVSATDETASAHQNLVSATVKNAKKIQNRGNNTSISIEYSNSNILKEEEELQSTSSSKLNSSNISAKTKKKSAGGAAAHGSKYPDGFFARCRTRYEVLREVNGWNEEYYFNAREVGNLRNLINAVAYGIRSLDATGTPMPVNYDEVYHALDEFFACIPARLLQQPMSIAQLYSSYNDIISEQAGNSRLNSPLTEGILAAFRQKITSLPAEYVATPAERRAALQLADLLTTSARTKDPACPTPTSAQLLNWCDKIFGKLNQLTWWSKHTGSIAFVVKNYNSIVAAIKQASTPAPTPTAKPNSGKIVPEHGTAISWKNPGAAAIFGIKTQ